MATVDRHADVVWSGSLQSGSGQLSLVDSGALKDAYVDFPSRSEQPGGKTSPEELIAGAHATCYAMALSNVLSEGGNEPEELNVSATCTLDLGSLKVSTLVLEVRGRVPGLDADGFQSAVDQADQVCPVTNALRGNVDVRVNATLA